MIFYYDRIYKSIWFDDFPQLLTFIHRAEVFFYLPKKYPMITVVIPFIILSLFLESLTQILYIYMYIVYIYILYIYICILYVYTYIFYIYISTHVFNHEILAAIDGNFPLKPSPKETSPAASGSRAVASASSSWCCSCCTCSRSMRSNACKEGGFHWDFTGISLGFHRDFMGFHVDFMGFNGISWDLMGFHGI